VYHHQAEEYDREFIKRYDEDMSTTLIFMGFFHTSSDVHVPFWLAGWSVLRRHFHIHHHSACGMLATDKRVSVFGFLTPDPVPRTP